MASSKWFLYMVVILQLKLEALLLFWLLISLALLVHINHNLFVHKLGWRQVVAVAVLFLHFIPNFRWVEFWKIFATHECHPFIERQHTSVGLGYESGVLWVLARGCISCWALASLSDSLSDLLALDCQSFDFFCRFFESQHASPVCRCIMTSARSLKIQGQIGLVIHV